MKAKELMVIDFTIEKAIVEKKKNVANQWVLNKPRNQSVVRSAARAKSLPRSQRSWNEPSVSSLQTSRAHPTQLSQPESIQECK